MADKTDTLLGDEPDNMPDQTAYVPDDGTFTAIARIVARLDQIEDRLAGGQVEGKCLNHSRVNAKHVLAGVAICDDCARAALQAVLSFDQPTTRRRRRQAPEGGTS